MGPKLLFILGIIAAHGALAAGWMHREPPKQRQSVATCVRAPGALPFISPQRELLAKADIPTVDLGVTQR
jgi:hypothetical protein